MYYCSSSVLRPIVVALVHQVQHHLACLTLPSFRALQISVVLLYCHCVHILVFCGHIYVGC
jgi:hypothetical protein